MNYKYYQTEGNYPKGKYTNKQLDVSFNECFLSLCQLQPFGDVPKKLQRNAIKTFLEAVFEKNSELTIDPNILNAETTFKTNISFVLAMMVSGIYLHQRLGPNQGWNLNSWWHLLKIPGSVKIINSNHSNKHPDLLGIGGNTAYVIDAKGSLIRRLDGKVTKKAVTSGIEQVKNVISVTVPNNQVTKIERCVITTGLKTKTADKNNDISIHVIDPPEDTDAKYKIFLYPQLLKILRHQVLLSFFSESNDENVNNKSTPTMEYTLPDAKLIMSKEQFKLENKYISEVNNLNNKKKEDVSKITEDLENKLADAADALNNNSETLYSEISEKILSKTNDGIYIIRRK